MTRWYASSAPLLPGKNAEKLQTKKRCRSGIPNRSAFLFCAFSCLVLHGKHVFIFYQVINQRNNGQNQCNPDQHGIQHGKCRNVGDQKNDHNHLADCFRFSPPAGCDDNSIVRRNQAETADDELSGNNDDDHPGRDAVHLDQCDHGGTY